MKTKTYIFHSDPGHGWLAVKRQELIDLGILNQISSCSYQRGKTVYLEEDCDYSIFMRAKETNGEDVKIRESYRDNTSVRNYNHFSS